MCGYSLTAQLKHRLDMIKRVENFSKTDLAVAREKLFENFIREILKNYDLEWTYIFKEMTR